MHRSGFLRVLVIVYWWRWSGEMTKLAGVLFILQWCFPLALFGVLLHARLNDQIASGQVIAILVIVGIGCAVLVTVISELANIRANKEN